MSRIDFGKIFLDRQVDDDRSGGVAKLKCPVDFAPFEGHFPGEPVLPGVIQVAAVRLFASDIAGVDLAPVSIERLKFSGMVKPQEELDLSVQLEKDGEQWKVRFRLKRCGDKISSGTVFYKEIAG